MRNKLVIIVLAAVVLSLVVLSGSCLTPVSANPSPGAIWTTDKDGNIVNQNLFEKKEDVYLNGGPKGGGGGLPDGNYYVQVTEPNGTVLGHSYPDTVNVISGSFNLVCLYTFLYTTSGYPIKGYDDTTNPGGEYKVWASMDPSFLREYKTDNFKVKKSEVEEKGQIEIKKLEEFHINLGCLTL